jgi:hypothetical protein
MLQENTDELMQQYIDSLSDKERKAYMIAKEHLATSFDLEKSNGYLKWKRAKTIDSNN